MKFPKFLPSSLSLTKILIIVLRILLYLQCQVHQLYAGLCVVNKTCSSLQIQILTFCKIRLRTSESTRSSKTMYINIKKTSFLCNLFIYTRVNIPKLRLHDILKLDHCLIETAAGFKKTPCMSQEIILSKETHWKGSVKK